MARDATAAAEDASEWEDEAGEGGGGGGKAFSRADNQTRQIPTHSDRPYPCKTYEPAFSQRLTSQTMIRGWQKVTSLALRSEDIDRLANPDFYQVGWQNRQFPGRRKRPSLMPTRPTCIPPEGVSFD